MTTKDDKPYSPTERDPTPANWDAQNVLEVARQLRLDAAAYRHDSQRSREEIKRYYGPERRKR